MRSLPSIAALVLAALGPAEFAPAGLASARMGAAGAPLAAGLHRIVGRVVDAAGQPVAGARVLVAEGALGTIFYTTPESAFVNTPGEVGVDPGVKGRAAAEVEAGGDGRFEIGALRGGVYSLLAVHAEKGLALASQPLESVESAEIEIALSAPSFVEGRVHDWVRDPTRHVLEIRSRRATGNVTILPRLEYSDDGHFRAGPLPPTGLWSVVGTEWVQERAYRGTLFAAPFEVKSGETAHVEIAMRGGIELTGIVRGPSGEPLAQVSVVARSLANAALERGAVTGADGRYTIRGLEAGRFALDARRWTVRSTAGCGVGPKDLTVGREVELPLASPGLADFGVPSLLDALAVGQPAPEVSVTTLDGRTLRLSDLRGKVVLVDFWATWCSMCRAQLPALIQTERRLAASKELVVVGVSVDEDPAAVQRFVRGFAIPWTQTALGPAEKNPLALAFNVSATPSCFVIDREGKIAARDLNGAELAAELERQLARRGVAK